MVVMITWNLLEKAQQKQKVNINYKNYNTDKLKEN